MVKIYFAVLLNSPPSFYFIINSCQLIVIVYATVLSIVKTNTIFSWMQDNTNPSPKQNVCKKKYLTINYIHLKNKASVSLSPSSQSVSSSSSHSLLTCPSSLMPFHNKPSSVPSTTLLKCLQSHFWWDALPCCYDPLKKKWSHWVSWFFQLGTKHGRLSRTTHHTAALIGFEWFLHHYI